MEENMNLKIKFYNNHFTKKIDNKKGMNIYNQNGQEYLIVERDYIYDLKLSDSLKDDYTSKVISDGNHQCSFIVDFNGIDNFIASKSLIFNDYDVRELVIKHLNLVEGKFKRFGASGSRPSEKHPGGEVVELQTMYENKVHSVPDRIVSISQPYIRPIARGKAKAPVEFGAKLDLSIDENGIARLERLSFDAYNESDVFITAVEKADCLELY